ncbi:recombination protein RecR [Candidatus Uhrbacteria bacterium]|nr:recombination protein RecR [Candidatus Uhrbacteria bacterium]
MSYPSTIQQLVDSFAKFPGIGEKSAQRFVFYLLRQPSQELIRFAKLIMNLPDAITVCRVCCNYSEKNPCAYCVSSSREQSMICVVAYSHDVRALERTGAYRGLYHVLGGTLNILDGVTPDKLRIKELMERLRNANKKIQEIILGFNPDLEGESTALYLSKLIKPYDLKITKLARGLPRGADIEYADDITLAEALKARREL